MVNLAVFASGNGSNFENIIHAIDSRRLTDARCALLVADHEDAYAIERAKRLHIPWIYVNPKAFPTKAEYEMAIDEKLREYGVDLIVLAGYMRYIGAVLLDKYPYRIINLHPAYLPAFPGAHSILDAYEAKAEYTGVTVHYVDAGVDSGEIIHQEKIIIDPDWDLETLEQHVHALEYDMFPRVIQTVVNRIKEETK